VHFDLLVLLVHSHTFIHYLPAYVSFTHVSVLDFLCAHHCCCLAPLGFAWFTSGRTVCCWFSFAGAGSFAPLRLFAHTLSHFPFVNFSGSRARAHAVLRSAPWFCFSSLFGSRWLLLSPTPALPYSSFTAFTFSSSIVLFFTFSRTGFVSRLLPRSFFAVAVRLVLPRRRFLDCAGCVTVFMRSRCLTRCRKTDDFTPFIFAFLRPFHLFTFVRSRSGLVLRVLLRSGFCLRFVAVSWVRVCTFTFRVCLDTVPRSFYVPPHFHTRSFWLRCTFSAHWVFASFYIVYFLYVRCRFVLRFTFCVVCAFSHVAA